MTHAEWIAKEIAGDRTLGTPSIEFDWGWYRIRCDTPNPDEGILVKNALVEMAREYIKLKSNLS